MVFRRYLSFWALIIDFCRHVSPRRRNIGPQQQNKLTFLLHVLPRRKKIYSAERRSLAPVSEGRLRHEASPSKGAKLRSGACTDPKLEPCPLRSSAPKVGRAQLRAIKEKQNKRGPKGARRGTSLAPLGGRAELPLRATKGRLPRRGRGTRPRRRKPSLRSEAPRLRGGFAPEEQLLPRS